LVIIFLGLAYAARTGAHVSLDIITLHLSKRPLGLLTAITSLLALFVSVVLAWQSIRIISDAFREKWATATVPTVIEWPFYTAMVLGSFVMCLEWIAKIVGGWRDFRHPPEPEPERNA
jgi:TRAP-type C4-dicarboxylate transport system permease small subunit